MRLELALALLTPAERASVGRRFQKLGARDVEIAVVPASAPRPVALWDAAAENDPSRSGRSGPYDSAAWTEPQLKAVLQGVHAVEPLREVRIAASGTEFRFVCAPSWTSFLPLTIARPFAALKLPVHRRLAGFSVSGFAFASDGLRAILR